MAVLKCKMCGGDLNVVEGQSVVECEYCGSTQTVPKVDDEKKLTLFARANRLRAACEFDKAAGIYETIVADFPEEAESYWGLVLCKYGIEYVDDPATGKKIPTCHRSSFDSVMEDGDFEQVLENSDSVARKVYREEAKTIEEIRKGIIAVSNNEQPYDIFICYKETAENGERTIDSVLAQDVYDALCDKGYRVFFSRITLEDKLGMEYEPYIFAALNSAKVMLVFGTDYEYFNAVWVKNEWSRFLKLMAKDKDKHLIPCYKGIDAYDMPKEFTRLQAQDLGKVGAVQDLLRGIEKILPKQKAETIVQERVVVGNSGNNKIESLLDRGNMALEDGDWAKADSFFEDVLNNDSKNAQAYIGKTLAQERCRTLDAFIRKRKDATENAKSEKQYISVEYDHIHGMAKKYAFEEYVSKDKIEELYAFDWSYSTQVQSRQQQYESEKAYWENHKQLSRAEKFATGAVAEILANEKKALFAVLSERCKQAEAAEEDAIKRVKAAYAAHIAKADKKAEQLYNEAIVSKAEYYEKLVSIAKTSTSIKQLQDTAASFDKLGDYQDSKNLAKHCRNRITEEQEKLAKEQERQRIIKEQAEKEKKAKTRKQSIIAVAAVCVFVAFVFVWTAYIAPARNYKDANALMASAQYKEAKEMFEELGDYKDSELKAQEATDALVAEETARINGEIEKARSLMEKGDFSAALEIIESLGDREDIAEIKAELVNEIDYAAALVYLEVGQDADAYAILETLGDFKDAKSYLEKFKPCLIQRETKYGYDNSVNTGIYTYDDSNRLVKVEVKNATATLTYHENGVLSEMRMETKTSHDLHRYNEYGHPIFFGWYNPVEEKYNQYWRFEYTYDTEGNVSSISGYRTEDGEDGTILHWYTELEPGDEIVIRDLVAGEKDQWNQFRNIEGFFIERSDGMIYEDYRFMPDSDLVDYYEYTLDEHYNTVQWLYYYKNDLNSEYKLSTTTQENTLTYNENGQLVAKVYSNREGLNRLEYTYDDNGVVTDVLWTIDGDFCRSDVFEYAWVYAE